MSIGIILLFIGTNIIPLTAENTKEEPTDILQKNDVERLNFPNFIYQKININNCTTELCPFSNQPIFDHSLNGHLSYRQSQQKDLFHLQAGNYDISPVSKDISFSHEAKGNYTPHDPIWIDGDAGFIEENGVVSGNGTIDDPYLIEGWEIISPYTFGIVVLNTKSYFLVRNCSFDTVDSCIGTANVTNGIFDSNILNCNMANGVYLDRSSNIWINNLHINSLNYYGLFLEDSSDIYFNNLTVNALVGLEGYYSCRLSFTNCSFSCSYPGYYGDTVGVAFYDSSCVILTNVIIHDYYFDSLNI